MDKEQLTTILEEAILFLSNERHIDLNLHYSMCAEEAAEKLLSDGDLASVRSRAKKWTEVVEILPDGSEKVKYRRQYGTVQAQKIMDEIDEIQKKSRYFYRHVI